MKNAFFVHLPSADSSLLAFWSLKLCHCKLQSHLRMNCLFVYISIVSNLKKNIFVFENTLINSLILSFPEYEFDENAGFWVGFIVPGRILQYLSLRQIDYHDNKLAIMTATWLSRQQNVTITTILAHYSDINWELCRLKSPVNKYWLKGLLNIIIKKTQMPSISDPFR